MIASLIEKLLTFLIKVVRILGLSIGNYEANLTIEGFRGVMQYDENESVNTDMRYAADAKNADTRDGNLLPTAKPIDMCNTTFFGTAGNAFVAPVLYPGTATAFSGSKAVAAFGVSASYPAVPGEKSTEIVLHDPYTNTRAAVNLDWSGEKHRFVSFLQYELNDTDGSHDILLMSTNENVMLAKKLDADIIQQIPEAPYHFGVIAKHGERIWGTAIDGKPDLLCYSEAYSPFNWRPYNPSLYPDLTPEDAAGEIRQPTFDGDKFIALVSFAGSLLAFKEHSLWRITGLSPDEYVFREQYGTGTIFRNTIVVHKEAVYFLTSKGLCVYDGATVHELQSYALRSVWRDLPWKSIDPRIPVATICNGRYILSYPGEENGAMNTKALFYDLNTGVWGSDVSVLAADAYCVLDGELLMYQQKPSQYPGYNGLHATMWYGSVGETPTEVLEDVPGFIGFDWLTPWSDMGAKDIVKNEYKLRFWIQTHMQTGDKLKLAVTLETERGEKTREILFDRDVDEEVKMRFHLSGRKVRMRFKLTDKDGNEEITSWCKIMGGVQLKADTSPD